ncbi:MAG TPA: TonB family protein [Opitutaceae bacterium]|nr:TonB family protein [Opitutaceae bacterium]
MDELDLGVTIRGFAAGQKVFSRYALRRILGRGGMGVVWLARDETLEIDVALKFLPDVVALDPESIRDLKRETRRSLDLTHPHIIRIYDFLQDGRAAAISMEYVPGDTLAALKAERGRPFEPAELDKWAGQLCEALAYAHERALVVHRDLKPANLMVDAHGDLKIADFGIAASVSDSVSRVSVRAGSSGTPVYMSPQQMMGEKPAVTDDIYSLGATLYDLVTGRPPFHSGNIIAQVQGKVPPRMADRRAELDRERGHIPESWERTVAACLAKEAKDRPQRAAEVVTRLRQAVAAAPPPLLPPKPAPSAAAVLPGPASVPPPAAKPKPEAPAPRPVERPRPIEAGAPSARPAETAPAAPAIASDRAAGPGASVPPTPAPLPAAFPTGAGGNSAAAVGTTPPGDAALRSPVPIPKPPPSDAAAPVAPRAEPTKESAASVAPAAPKVSSAARYVPGGAPAPSRAGRKTGRWLATAAAAVVLAGAGYYFLVQRPAADRAATESAIAAARVQLDEAATAVRHALGTADWAVAEARLGELDQLGPVLRPEVASDWQQLRAVLRADFERGRETARVAGVRIPVTVTTTPAGAEVVAGGTVAGTTPLKDWPLPLGDHAITLRRPGHEDLAATLAVRERGQTEWNFPLAVSRGELQLAGLPGGAGFKVFPAVEPGGLPAMPLADGRLPASVDLPVGQYDVVVTSPGSGPAITSRARVTVRRGETTNHHADVRGASVQVVTTPAGATVLINGQPAGTTPLLLAGQPYGARQEIELRHDGYVAHKRTIEFPASADAPAQVAVVLEMTEAARRSQGFGSVAGDRIAVIPSGPAVTSLRPDLTRGPTRLTLESKVRNTVTSSQVGAGTHRTGPIESTAASREIVTLSEPATDGTWRRIQSELVESDGMLAGTIVEFGRGPDRWTARFARGGFASGGMSADYLYPAYLGLALAPETVGDVRVAAGQEWSVPLSATRLIVLGSFFVAPEGTIRGRVKAVDPAERPAWVDIEYSFDVRGAVRLPGMAPTAGLRTEMSGHDTGTLTLRLQLREAYVSESRFERRSVIEGKTTPVGSTLSVSASSFTNEVVSLIETKATPAPAAVADSGALFTRPGAPDGTIYEPRDLDRQPRPLSRAAPSYPAAQQRAGVTGSVTVEFVVDAHGAVQHARVVSATHRAFEGPALAAVRTWTFQAGQKGGRPVAVRLQVPIQFQLAD